jgi:SAM-dependent methyltransferase
MFEELPRLLALRKEIRTILDIGCGYGVPACWCLENYEDARIIGLEPDPERVRVAAIAFGSRGTVSRGWAPDLPAVPDGSADVVLLLDMLHYLDDQTAAEVFSRSFHALAPGAILAARFVIRPEGRPSWSWRLEDARVRIAGRRPFYRSAERMSALLEAAGFLLIINELTAANPELVWMVGRAEKGEPCGTRT